LELSLVRVSVEDSYCKKKPTNFRDDSQEKKWCVRAAARVNKVDTLLPYGHSSETMSEWCHRRRKSASMTYYCDGLILRRSRLLKKIASSTVQSNCAALIDRHLNRYKVKEVWIAGA